MDIITHSSHTTKDRIRKGLTSRQEMVLGKLQSCFVIKLTASFSNEAAIFLVSPIKNHPVIELLAYLEILSDTLCPHVVMSVADDAFILRRYYGFKEMPHKYLKHVALSGISVNKPLRCLEQLCSRPSRFEPVKNSIWKLWHRTCTQRTYYSSLSWSSLGWGLKMPLIAQYASAAGISDEPIQRKTAGQPLS